MPGRGRQFAIGFAIAILFPMIVFYGTTTFFPRPDRTQFVQPVPFVRDATPEERQAAQEKQRQQQTAFDHANAHFNSVLFYVALGLGYAAVLAGSFMGPSVVGTGLLFGGIFAVLEGFSLNGSNTPAWIKLVSLLVAAVLVLNAAYRKIPQLQPTDTKSQ